MKKFVELIIRYVYHLLTTECTTLKYSQIYKSIH